MYKEAYGFLANDNPVMGRHFLGKAYELVTLLLAMIWPTVFVTDGSASGIMIPPPKSTGNWPAKETQMP